VVLLSRTVDGNSGEATGTIFNTDILKEVWSNYVVLQDPAPHSNTPLYLKSCFSCLVGIKNIPVMHVFSINGVIVMKLQLI
jgi:hypothetical protein